MQRARALVGEFIGSALLTMVVVGSGIAAQQLSPNAIGLELLENAAATAAALFVLITVLAPVSGAHFNPLVTWTDIALGRRSWRDGLTYPLAQVLGCSLGAIASNVMFGLHALELSTHHRASLPHLTSEVIATAGLILVIVSLVRRGQSSSVASSVACYIGAAYFFTSSTSFANPAICVGRMLSNSFAGIAPSSVPGFVVAQLIGAAIGLALAVFLTPKEPHVSA